MTSAAPRSLSGFISALFGRSILAAGTALLVLGAGSFVLGPTQSDGLGDYLLPSYAPDASPEPSLPVIVAFPSIHPATTPSITPTISPDATPGETPVPTPSPLTHRVTRIVLARANVDLPVVEPPPNETFPYCDVAERLPYYDVPGNNGLTYLYAHARPKMFGGLLVASWKPDSYLLGALVQVYTSDNLRYTYKITEIHRRQNHTSWKIADGLLGEALIMQASEDSSRVGTKLVVVARPVRVSDATQSEANPKPRPRACD